MMPTTSDEVLKKFADSVLTLLGDLKAKNGELKKAKESERTKIFYTQKMIKNWFYHDGNIR